MRWLLEDWQGSKMQCSTIKFCITNIWMKHTCTHHMHTHSVHTCTLRRGGTGDAGEGWACEGPFLLDKRQLTHSGVKPPLQFCGLGFEKNIETPWALLHSMTLGFCWDDPNSWRGTQRLLPFVPWCLRPDGWVWAPAETVLHKDPQCGASGGRHSYMVAWGSKGQCPRQTAWSLWLDLMPYKLPRVTSATVYQQEHSQIHPDPRSSHKTSTVPLNGRSIK